MQELLSSIEVPTRLGFKFDGWYIDSFYEKKFNAETSITEPVHLYAKWTKSKTNSLQ